MTRQSTKARCDALARIQDALTKPHQYKPITHERAAELADSITPYDDDETVYALIELLLGIVNAHYKKGDVEGLAMYATYRAYSKTVHFCHAFEEFANLNPDDKRDARVLRREFLDSATEEVN